MEDSPKKYPFIPDDALIDIKISGFFYKKLQTLLIYKCSKVKQEDLLKILEKLKTNQPAETIEEAEIHVLTALVHEVEKVAKDTNKIEYKEVPPQN